MILSSCYHFTSSLSTFF